MKTTRLLHTRSSLSRACCLNFSKLLADDVGREREEPELFVRLDQEGTCRIGLGVESCLKKEKNRFNVTTGLRFLCHNDQQEIS